MASRLNLDQARHLCEVLEKIPIQQLGVSVNNTGENASFTLKNGRESINLWRCTIPATSGKIYDEKQGYWVEDVPILYYELLLETPRNRATLEVKHGLFLGGRIFDMDLNSEEGRFLSTTYNNLMEKYDTYRRLQREKSLDE